MRRLALIVVLAASPAAAASADAEQAQVAERLSARAQDALDGILGPGRSKVEIDVVGEHSEVNSDAEFLFPVDQGSAKAGKASGKAGRDAYQLDLPGYVKDKAAEEAKNKAAAASASQSSDAPFGSVPFNRTREASRHDSGFQIKAIHATAVFDSALDSATVREASQLLPQLLNIDTTRGDTLSLLRAPMRPAWKEAFATPSDWRSASYALGGGLVALLFALIVFAGLVGAGRALGRSLGRELAGLSRPSEPALPQGSAEPLPELAPGAAGFLEAEGSGGGGAGAAPLLGRRFDFLSGRDPELIARAVSSEKPEELSLFFGHLAESIPDLASRLFSHLTPDVQAEVSKSLMTLSVADPDRLTAIEERLRQAVENGVMGPQSLGRILSRVSGDARADLLGRLDSRAVEEVERHMFSFEDLDGVESASLRRLLGAVPYETWGPALRGAPRALVEAVLADLPEGPRELVREAAAVPQQRDKIEEARSKILDAYVALAAKGELALGRAGGKKAEDLV